MGVENPNEWASDAEIAGAERTNDALLLGLLRAARGKLAQGWTRAAFARDARGEQLVAESPDAVCWCALGAVRASMESVHESASADEAAHDALFEAIDEPLEPDFGDAIIRFNDGQGRTQAEVLALFDRAVAAVEARLAPEAGASS